MGADQVPLGVCSEGSQLSSCGYVLGDAYVGNPQILTAVAVRFQQRDGGVQVISPGVDPVVFGMLSAFLGVRGVGIPKSQRPSRFASSKGMARTCVAPDARNDVEYACVASTV